MKYSSESFGSLPEAYRSIRETGEFNTIDRSELHDRSGEGVSDVEVCYAPGELVIVSCLKHDSSPSEFFEDGTEQGEFHSFRSSDSRDEFLATLKKSSLFYLVDKYEHSGVHYSVAQTANYPDRRWDVSHASSVFIPCDYIQDEYKKAKKSMTVAEAKKKFIQDSNSILEEYSKYCNGESYGYSAVVYDKQGNVLEEEEIWGFTGKEYANEEKTSFMKGVFNDSIISSIVNNVEIVKFTDPYQTPEISSDDIKAISEHVSLKDVVAGQYVEIYGTKILAAINKDKESSFVYCDNGSGSPTVSTFGDFQKQYNIEPENFVQSRFINDLKKAIGDNLKEKEKKSLNKISPTK